MKYKKVTFYTVHIEGKERNEMEDFLMRHYQYHQSELQELTRIIEIIGEDYGVVEQDLRFENDAFALPPPTKRLRRFATETRQHERFSSQNQTYTPNFGLRLYCVLVSESALILLNGGVKTRERAQDCPNVSSYFQLANRIANAINKELYSGDLKLNAQRRLDLSEFENEQAAFYI